MIQLHRLEGFYWVAKTGGYARAARAFPYPITQPAIHQQVKKLESELGLALFERLGKESIKPTAAGAALYDFCRPFFEGLPGVLRAIQAGQPQGELVIHAETILVRQLMPEWIKRVASDRPDAIIALHEVNRPEIDRLRLGEVDVIIAHLPEIPRDIAYEVVAELRPFLVLPANHPKARRKNLSLGDLRDETFVSYHRDMLPFRLQMEALESFAIEPPRILEAATADSILSFVQAGLGFSLVPSMDRAGPRVPGVVVRPIRKPRPSFAVHLAWRKDMPENPLFELLLRHAPKP
ncbi:MAG: LysR family transcriptional regulator [Planctomycetes bacterium]|nr:LysR family transcriptional regulator [Planctomycetota bacterium]